uniref:Uncharacterized protein n=1 Tax=Myotis myotis TaxID=51298 RepID=A0A7J7WWB9_MYOMY|nr:hypothetical protein mMyoMyo1_011999 [Myotis myotis]
MQSTARRLTAAQHPPAVASSSLLSVWPLGSPSQLLLHRAAKCKVRARQQHLRFACSAPRLSPLVPAGGPNQDETGIIMGVGPGDRNRILVLPPADRVGHCLSDSAHLREGDGSQHNVLGLKTAHLLHGRLLAHHGTAAVEYYTTD